MHTVKQEIISYFPQHKFSRFNLDSVYADMRVRGGGAKKNESIKHIFSIIPSSMHFLICEIVFHNMI